MALDGIYLSSLVYELKDNILNKKVEKIYQPEKDEIIIIFRENKNKKLVISSSAKYPKIHLSEMNKQNPPSPPMFCMILRKYLSSSILKDIYQVENDRIVILEFTAKNELDFENTYLLIVEIMGKHSNISLVRKSDGIIMDAIKHVPPSINTYRTVLSGAKYVYPPKSLKLDPHNFTRESLKNYIEENKIEINEKSFSSIFIGISNVLSKELYFRYKALNSELYEFSMDFFNNIFNGNYNFTSYLYDNVYKYFSCTPLTHLEDGYTEIHYSSPSVQIESFYKEKDGKDRTSLKTHDLNKLLINNIERCKKKIEILNENLKLASLKDEYKIKGELLTSYIHSIKEGNDKIILNNYYDDNNEIEIQLDPLKSPSQNIMSYFNKYNKYKKMELNSLEQLKISSSELVYLESVLQNLSNSETLEDIEDVRKELSDSSYLRFKKNKVKIKPSQPLHFLSTDGSHIYVGKNNIQNDYLTTKFASKNDYWLHTKDIPGSHVIIKNDGNVTDLTLTEGAILASYYSKAKNSSNVPVDFTEIKNVKKPGGAKPGMVIYVNNKTKYVTPYEINLKKF